MSNLKLPRQIQLILLVRYIGEQKFPTRYARGVYLRAQRLCDQSERFPADHITEIFQDAMFANQFKVDVLSREYLNYGRRVTRHVEHWVQAYPRTAKEVAHTGASIH